MRCPAAARTPRSPSTPSPHATPTPTNGTSGGSGTTGTGGGDVCEEGSVLPAEENHPGDTDTDTSPTEETGVLPATENSTQPARQAAAAGTTSQLPFTGFAAIPVLLGGLALLTGGLILRRRTN